MKWVNKPSKEVLATSARMHQKICAIIICATKPCQPVACSQKAFSSYKRIQYRSGKKM